MSAIREAIAEGCPVILAKQGTATSSPLASGAIPFAGFEQIMVVIALGDMAAETIDAKLQTCDSDGTSNLADLKLATQLAAHATNNDQKAIVFNVREEDMIASGKSYFRALVTTGAGSGGAIAIVALGSGAKYGPGSDHDNAQVVEIVYANA